MLVIVVVDVGVFPLLRSLTSAVNCVLIVAFAVVIKMALAVNAPMLASQGLVQLSILQGLPASVFP